MSLNDNPHISEAVVRVLSEHELAEWRREQGYKVIEAHGRYWWQTYRGFYQSMHWLARFTGEEARRPSWAGWGFRAALTDDAISMANSAIPIHLVGDTAAYDVGCLHRTKRKQLQQAKESCRIVWVTTPDLLREQGYRAFRDTGDRLGLYQSVSPEKYRSTIDAFVTDSRRLVAAAIVDDRLAAYLEQFAVDGVGYVWQICITNDALAANAGTCLLYEAAQAYRRSGLVSTIVNGLHRPEQPGLCRYKKQMGFRVVQIPSRTEMLPLVGRVMCRIKPWAYYRLVGAPCEANQEQADGISES